ncbi:endonuclease/exonuclease/phosphatase family protein [Auraticoccus monumenti]|uniref:Endonuclease/Exonuclease/phosphatase family protein n=1 Tax=Auraticoccus monumenti TaxID=675864 RepID=A0A1G6ZGA7_9ACTN|nr:endonuclease/exonuclease/phosphatase family protein [Auraticoccus monumenti]SDE01724.1 Endonuclease/Exonuclease/phosphatase family protein [Auraticoccus monumenti]
MRRRLTSLTAALAALLLALVLAPASPPAAAEDSSTGTPTELRVITYNMNQFRRDGQASRIADLQRLLDQTDVLLLQEAKGFNIPAIVRGGQGGEGFVVHQAADRDSAEAGSAVVTRRSILGPEGVTDFRFVFGVRGASTAECDDHPSGGHGPRWIATARLHLVDGTTLPVASAHLPPPRCHGTTFVPMMNSVKSLLREADGQMIMGADWNTALRSQPQDVWGGSTGYRYQAPRASIDGFVFPRSMSVVSRVQELDIRRPGGDHHPVRMVVRLAG